MARSRPPPPPKKITKPAAGSNPSQSSSSQATGSNVSRNRSSGTSATASDQRNSGSSVSNTDSSGTNASGERSDTGSFAAESDSTGSSSSEVVQRSPDRPPAVQNPDSPDPILLPAHLRRSNRSDTPPTGTRNSGSNESEGNSTGTNASGERSDTGSFATESTSTSSSSSYVVHRTPDRPPAVQNPDSPDPILLPAHLRRSNRSSTPPTGNRSRSSQEHSTGTDAPVAGPSVTGSQKRKQQTAKGGPKSRRLALASRDKDDSDDSEAAGGDHGHHSDDAPAATDDARGDSDSGESQTTGDFDGQLSDDLTNQAAGSNNDGDAVNDEADVNVDDEHANTPEPQNVAGSNRSRRKATPKKRPTAAKPQGARNNRGNQQRRILKEVARLRNATHNMVPKSAFQRCVREAMNQFEIGGKNFRITPEALAALQESAEMYVTQFFEDAYSLTLHRGRVTLNVKDMQLIHYLRRRE